MRSSIFISHANPEDNDQARWLGLQLITLGYKVWCDVFNLKGGEKFWKEIEFEIRNNTCKFLYILTNNSNQKDGCLNELSVAEAVEKQVGDKYFIIALHFDNELKYDDININLKRKIDLDFKTDWQHGLKDLLRILNEEPKVKIKENPDFNFIQNYWATIYLNDRRPIEKEETYSSNWFPIVGYPEYLFFHDFKGSIPKNHEWGKMPYPTYGYKKLTATFGTCFDFKEKLPKTENYDPTRSLKYNVLDILHNNIQDDFILNRTLRNIVNNLISKGFINTMIKKGNSILTYELSNKTSFCFPVDVNDEKKFSHGQLVGKILDKNWHFAFSGFPELTYNVFVIRSHILFSENNVLIESSRIQHTLRRRQGSKWWNKHWKHKLLSTILKLVDNDGFLKIEVGSNNYVTVSGESCAFKSKVSYIDPEESREALDDYPEEDINESIEQ